MSGRLRPAGMEINNRSSDRNHYLYDSIRGAGTDADIAPNTTDAENNNTGTYGYLWASILMDLLSLMAPIQLAISTP